MLGCYENIDDDAFRQQNSFLIDQIDAFILQLHEQTERVLDQQEEINYSLLRQQAEEYEQFDFDLRMVKLPAYGKVADKINRTDVPSNPFNALISYAENTPVLIGSVKNNPQPSICIPITENQQEFEKLLKTEQNIMRMTASMSELAHFKQLLKTIRREKINNVYSLEQPLYKFISHTISVDLFNVNEELQWIVTWRALSVIYDFLLKEFPWKNYKSKDQQLINPAQIMNDIATTLLLQPFEKTADLRLAIISLAFQPAITFLVLQL